MNNKILKYSVFLLVLGLITGLLLGAVNSITAPIIEERAIEEATAALRENFDYDSYSLSQIAEYPDADKAITEIFYAFDSSGALEAVVYQTATSGYASGNTLVTLIAIKVDGTFDNAVLIAHGDTPAFANNVLEHDFEISNDSINSYYPVISSGATATSNGTIAGIDAAANHFKTIQNDLGGITND